MRTRIVTISLLSLFAMSSCAKDSASTQPAAMKQPGQPGAASTHQNDETAVVSSNGTYFVRIAPPPAQIPANQLFSLHITVLDGADRATVLRDVRLSADATMPAHHHGMNTRPKVTANPDGSFTVDGMLLHMSGDWELAFDITRHGVTERATMPVTLE